MCNIYSLNVSKVAIDEKLSNMSSVITSIENEMDYNNSDA